ncbi:MAG: sugar phosphate isomerase/epimerase, partial [Candidatus Brockarchaeota archaeon]|nr:sugar phosphate isomerase/epimerase [Candidatus Brockarchaeota archaeon]
MKFSVQENLVPGANLEEKLRKLENYGYDGIELWGRQELGGVLKNVLDVLSTTSVKVSTICSGYSGSLLSPRKEDREAALKGIKERLEWANRLGAVGVITVPVFGEATVPDLSPLFKDKFELEWKLAVEEYRILGRHARDVGSIVIVEPLNRYETHFLKTLSQAASLCEEVGLDEVRIMADYFHMSIEEADIGSSLRKHLEKIVHVHLADSNRLTPGRGHTDFSSLRVLREGGYKHYLTLECGIPGEPDEELRRTL